MQMIQPNSDFVCLIIGHLFEHSGILTGHGFSNPLLIQSKSFEFRTKNQVDLSGHVKESPKQT